MSVAAGSVLVVSALVVGVDRDPVTTLGAVPEAVTTIDATTDAPAPPDPSPSPATRVTQTAAPSAPAARLTPTVPTRPERLRVAALDVMAPVVPVALTPNGAMELPDDVTEVGWFSSGPAPGQSGSTVIAGHVDSREQGRGVLFDLPDLVPGDTVEVDGQDGSTTTWRVTGRTAYAKDTLPIAELFRRDGPARLVLITCGGEFDPATGHYQDNVVVIAEPA